MTTQMQRGSSGSVDPYRTETSRNLGVGTIIGGTLLLVVGSINIIQGITLLSQNELLQNSYLYDNVTFWGWAFLIWGALQVIGGGMAAVSRRAIGLCVVLASVGIVGWFLMIFAAPFAAIVGIMLNMVIVWGMCSDWAAAE